MRRSTARIRVPLSPPCTKACNALVKAGLVRELNLGPVVRFESKTDWHHHFVCSRCSRVEDIEWFNVPRLAQRSSLVKRPIREYTLALRGEGLRPFQEQLPEWRLIAEHHLEKSWLFPDFRKGLEFVNRIGELAEEQGHHPDLYLSWGQVKAQIYTHKARGLTESDFILASKIDRLGTPWRKSRSR